MGGFGAKGALFENHVRGRGAVAVGRHRVENVFDFDMQRLVVFRNEDSLLMTAIADAITTTSSITSSCCMRRRCRSRSKVATKRNWRSTNDTDKSAMGGP